MSVLCCSAGGARVYGACSMEHTSSLTDVPQAVALHGAKGRMERMLRCLVCASSCLCFDNVAAGQQGPRLHGPELDLPTVSV